MADLTAANFVAIANGGYRHLVLQAHVDFGVSDLKRRAVGCRIDVAQVFKRAPNPALKSNGGTEDVGYTTVETTEQTGFAVGIQSTRNGMTFGASFPTMTPVATIEEAKVLGLKKAAASMRRQIRQFGATPPLNPDC